MIGLADGFRTGMNMSLDIQERQAQERERQAREAERQQRMAWERMDRETREQDRLRVAGAFDRGIQTVRDLAQPAPVQPTQSQFMDATVGSAMADAPLPMQGIPQPTAGKMDPNIAAQLQLAEIAAANRDLNGLSQATTAVRGMKQQGARQQEFQRLAGLSPEQLAQEWGPRFQAAGKNAGMDLRMAYNPETRMFELKSNVPGFEDSVPPTVMLQSLMSFWDAGNGDVDKGLAGMLSATRERAASSNEQFGRSATFAGAQQRADATRVDDERADKTANAQAEYYRALGARAEAERVRVPTPEQVARLNELANAVDTAPPNNRAAALQAYQLYERQVAASLGRVQPPRALANTFTAKDRLDFISKQLDSGKTPLQAQMAWDMASNPEGLASLLPPKTPQQPTTAQSRGMLSGGVSEYVGSQPQRGNAATSALGVNPNTLLPPAANTPPTRNWDRFSGSGPAAPWAPPQQRSMTAPGGFSPLSPGFEFSPGASNADVGMPGDINNQPRMSTRNLPGETDTRAILEMERMKVANALQQATAQGNAVAARGLQQNLQAIDGELRRLAPR